MNCRYSSTILLAVLGWGLTILAAKFVRWGLSPATWLPHDRPVIYVGKACGGAGAISRAVLARDDLEDSVYLAPVFSLSEMGPKYEAADREFVQTVCERTVPQVERLAPWLRILSSSTQCQWLADDATTHNNELAAGGLPNVVLGGARIAWEKEREVFEGFGVLYDVSQPGVALVRPLAAQDSPEPVEAPPAANRVELAGSGEPLKW